MLNSDLQKLSVAGLVTLYELDATNLGGGLYRWHGHVNHEDWQYIFGYVDKTQFVDASTRIAATDTVDILRRDIIWQGNRYSPIGIKSDGLEMRGDGQPSTPTLVVDNVLNGQVGAITAMCAFYSDFVDAKLRVVHLLARHLDAANFTAGNPFANPGEFNEQYWTVEQKTQETVGAVSFELANPLNAQRKQIPTRTITPYCTWAVCGRYRGEECGYTGAAMFTKDGIPTDNPALDKCGGRLNKDCKPRFGEHEPLGFGGFPASQLLGR